MRQNTKRSVCSRRSRRSRRRICIVCILAACAWLMGCEPAPTDGLFVAQELDAGGASADGSGNADVAASSGMTGQWLLATDWSTCVTIGGPPVELRTRKLLLVEMVHKGHRIKEQRTVCSVETTQLIGLKTLVPKAVAQAGGTMAIEATIFSEEEGGSYSSEAEVQLWGAKLKDPLADPMPTVDDAQDPTLVDTDGDGKPGATLRIDGICDIYVTQRAVATVVGTVDKDGNITGEGLHTTEQHVLSATKPICAQKYTTAPNDLHNSFLLGRGSSYGGIDTSGDGVVDCDELIAGQSKLVKWIEPDDQRCKKP